MQVIVNYLYLKAFALSIAVAELHPQNVISSMIVYKKTILILLTVIATISADAQEKKLSLRAYLSPSLCRSPTQYIVTVTGQVPQTRIETSGGIFLGLGFELLKPLKNNWLIAGDLSYLSKGYFANDRINNDNGNLRRTDFTRVELMFLESTFSLEKQIIAKNPKNKYVFSAGLFYGLHLPGLVQFRLRANGNDFGSSISAGVHLKRLLFELDYRKGLINIKNNVNASFRTNVMSFKIGYSIL